MLTMIANAFRGGPRLGRADVPHVRDRDRPGYRDTS